MSKLFKTTFAVLAIAATVNAANAPEPRSVEELNAVLAKAAKSAPADSLKEINIVLVADKKDHGLNEHDYPLWQERWGRLLEGKPGALGIWGPDAPGRPRQPAVLPERPRVPGAAWRPASPRG